MGIQAAEREGHGIGGKTFCLELASSAAIYGVRVLRTKPRHVEVPCACAHFLVRRKPDSYRSMRNLWVCNEEFCGCHDFRNARLVICTKERRPRRGDDVVADLLGKRRVVG